jgi:hypothetical protein
MDKGRPFMAKLDALPRKRAYRSLPWVCLASCGMTVLILMVVYALRGIWPFGTDNIAYMDAAQFYLPGYYKLWDVLHGADRNLTWYAGLIESTNISLSTLCDPASWVFFFVARDHVLEAMSLYLAAQMAGVALVTSLVIGLRFPHTDARWQVLLALGYTFSGFVLQYYSNFFWMWTVALFPLLLFSLERLLRDGRYVLFTLVYIYYLTKSVYYVYMVTLYILLFTFGYCLFVLPKAQRGDRLFRLGMSAAAAFGITVYYWMSSSSSIAGTSRFQSNLDSGLLTGFTTWNIPNTRHTVLMLLGMALTAALALMALRHQRQLEPEARKAGRKILWFFAFLMGMLCIPMVFTNIDTAWHFGQYNFFPMRYGYMLPATMLAGAGLILEQDALCPVTLAAPRRPWLHYGLIACLAAALAWAVPTLIGYWQAYGSCFLTTLGKKEYWRYFALYVGCGLLYVGLYLLLFRLKRPYACLAAAAVLLIQLGANTYGMLAPDDDHTYTHEYDPAYLETAESLYDYFSAQDISPLSRAKNVDNSLNAGYPAVAGISALSSVRSANSNLRLGVFQELGYTINYFRILDTGGTVFSDMLLGVDYILSASPLDETLYDHGDVVDGIEVGTARYPGRIGLQFAGGALDDYLELLTLPDRLNALYQAFTGTQDTLAYVPQAELTVQGEGLQTYTLTCQLPETGFLYLASDGMMMNISADGQTVTVPSYLNLDNTVYPAAFNANLLYMGCFDGTVEITFQSAAALTMDDLTLVALDKDMLDSFYASAYYDPDTTVTTDDNSITITLTADQADMYLFLPITADSRWHCTVNGQSVSQSYVLGTLMSLPLEQGENTVTLVRTGYGFRLTRNMCISLACLGLALLWLVLRRFCPAVKALALPPWAQTACWWLFCLVFAAMFAFIYLTPTYYLLTQGTIVTF